MARSTSVVDAAEFVDARVEAGALRSRLGSQQSVLYVKLPEPANVPLVDVDAELRARVHEELSTHGDCDLIRKHIKDDYPGLLTI